ncbi:MAG TPA: metalloregulator ArsR/SmtB family transcription factor [Herpetosiphonaceae bacterium]|nr:metalloregulator ArsR/SmtB family transcription factor [Herpetosiphonaceae bacterium]
MTDALITPMAELFKAMGDPTRLRILLTLMQQGERCVGDIALAVGMSDSAVSHQLRVLRGLRIVHAHKQGRTVTYCLDDDHIRTLLGQALDHQQHNAGQR